MPPTKTEQVLKELQDLLRLEDVQACMLANKGLGGIVPPGQKINNANLFKLIRDTTNQLFDIIGQFYDYKLERLNMELANYTIIIAPVSRELGLVVVVPSLANMGLLDVEIDNTKENIQNLLKKKEEQAL
jgi:predicted regulator of Ras-like GTPase activity (Roadblock/LC7/MglB family)